MSGYSVIYADPAWAYNDATPRGGAEHHYRTMSLQDIHAMGSWVPKIAAPDCALFIWATWPLLPEALSVIASWDFKYKNCGFLWVKTTKAGTDAMGLGHHTRGNSEPCLLATRGNPKRIDASVRQVCLEEREGPTGAPREETVFSQRGPHSAKPAIVREKIVQLYGDVPRIELFAREVVPGWHGWGNEYPGPVAP